MNDKAMRIEAARLATSQCNGDPRRFNNLAEAIYLFLTAARPSDTSHDESQDQQG